MKTTGNDVQTCKLLQGGRWIDAKTADFEPVTNPSDGSVIAKTPMCGRREVDQTVRAARIAFETCDQRRGPSLHKGAENGTEDGVDWRELRLAPQAPMPTT